MERQTTRRLDTDFYLPDDCLESIFKFIITTNSYRSLNSLYLNSLSLVSKQFLSITNSLRFSLTIRSSTPIPSLPCRFQRFTKLTSLNLKYFNSDIDALLCQISHFPLNLTSLNLSNKLTIPVNGIQAFSQNITTLTSLTCSRIYSFNGTDLFLIADCFPLLEELDLSKPIMLENYKSLHNGVEALSTALYKLWKVNLTSHHYIKDQSLFHLFNNWKLLEEVVIRDCYGITKPGIAHSLRDRSTLRSFSFSGLNFKWEDCDVSAQLKFLEVTCNSWLTYDNIKMFASIFPNLQLLDLRCCHNISEEGICQVLRCSEIRHLNFTGCLHVKLRGMNFEVSNLEVLNLSCTRFDDETLYVISKSCSGLLQLLLVSCKYVTEKGVKHVRKNCIQLREINLRGCDQVHADIVDKMVFSRPSLRKITAPPRYDFSDKKRKLFLRHGCLVS
ncbi:putative leucine-rich repeat domain, L domain-containing protein [Medicago truncatula]|uniref:Putative leucine-rich repeat domain, L domain-containing protein n=1 Tax=Medicago truncatula TaxID=3880 RepID=G7LCX9_MEDTR|nr:F-box/LRR-repeat protein 7 [Medicago truncatula]AET03810.1 RNI superfamily protein, putative [Medicago truncatula]RHN41995.1 putative leucine-rich repeat domain, L domain-containing protein [Medicago truncatula]